MAQPFSMRYLLVDGQGNFGSVDGDPPAAMRYTEVRMTRITHELLADIDKDTVDFTPNYDETESEPSVLPTRVPNLLVNGQTGIAVGMATNIPPHNLTEIIDACVALLDDPALPLAALMQHMPGPDFPTGGIINGAQEIATAYRTGRGRLSVRARVVIEDVGRGDRQAIVVTELPFQVNKARLHRAHRRAGAREAASTASPATACAMSPTRTACGVVIELKRGEVDRDRPQQPLRPDADGDGVRHQHGGAAGRAAEADVAEGDARGLHPPSARGGHPPHHLRSRARRASAPTSSRGSRSRSPTSTR